MAELKIFNEIVDAEEKLYASWMGQEAVCFADVRDFISSMAEYDNKIDIRIHCAGGDCVEGWAMYDALRTSGKEISVTIEGECASMATIILMAAPVERRFATENSRILIHNPSIAYMDLYTAERLTADTMETLKAKLDAQERLLIDEQERIVNLYIERTTADRDTLVALMKEEQYMDVAKAKELGFIGEVLAPNTDKSNSKAKNIMKETKVKTSLLNRALAKLGIAKLEDLAPKDQVITAANGDELVVTRDEGNPQVGDEATVNGEKDGKIVLDDGTTVVVTDGSISSVETPEPPKAEDENEKKIEDLNTEVAALKDEKQHLQDEFDAFKASAADEKQKLQDEFDAFKATAETEKTKIQDELNNLKPMMKTEAEKEILDFVEKAGGKDWLEKVKNVSSSFGGSPRQFRTHNEEKPEDTAKLGESFLEAKRKSRGMQ